MAYTATEKNAYCVPDQLLDGISTPSYKWFALHNNILDGTYHPLSSSGAYQIGWWGTSISDSAGSISNSPNIVLTFSSRSLNSIIIAGDTQLNEYPVNFVYSVYNSGGTLLYTKTITANTLLKYIECFPTTYQDVVKISLTITKISRSASVVKIVEAFDYYHVIRVDSLTPKITDVVNSLGSRITTTDALNPKAADIVSSTQSSRITADSILPKLSDITLAIINHDIAYDTILTKLTEFIPYKIFGSSEQIKTLLTEIADTNVNTTTLDELKLLLADVDAGIINYATSFDTVLPMLIDTLLYKLFGSIDSIKIRLDDITTTMYNYLTSIDTLLNTIADINDGIENTARVSDAVITTLNEFIPTKAFGSVDNIQPKINDLRITLNNVFTTTDILLNVLNDIVARTNVTLTDNDVIKTIFSEFISYKKFGTIDTAIIGLSDLAEAITNTLVRLEDILIDPLVDDTILFTSTDIQDCTVGEQIANNITTTEYKWFNLHNAILNGQWHPIDSKKNYEIGWWSNSISDDMGNFATPVKATIRFVDSTIDNIKVFGDYMTDSFPVDFTVNLYNRYGALLYSQVVTDNSEIAYMTSINPVENVTVLEISVTKINHVNEPVKILDVYPLYRKTLIGNMLMALDDVIITAIETNLQGIHSLQQVVDVLVPVGVADAVSSTAITAASSDNVTPRIDTAVVASSSAVRTDGISILLNDMDVGIINTLMCLDSLLAKLSDMLLPINVTALVQDVISPAFIEAVLGITLPINTTDAIKLKLIEATNSMVSSIRVDEIRIQISELLTCITNYAPEVDVLTPETEEAVISTNVSAEASDVVLSRIDMADNAIVSFARTEEIKARIDDLLVYKQFGSVEDVKVKFVETLVIYNTFSSFDSLTALLQDATAYIGSKFYSQDALKIKVTEQGGDIKVSFTSPDGLIIKLDEDINMTNVHTKMDEDLRQIFGKVEIVYSDPLIDVAVAYNASSINPATDLLSVADGITTPPYKWFAIFDNKLDGSYHPLDSSKKLSTGWWGYELSDSLGNFATSQMLEATFSARPIIELSVIGDATADIYPEDFVLTLWSGDTIVHTETVIGNINAEWHKIIDQINGITKMHLEITKMNKCATARVNEFFTIIKEEYVQDQIISMHLLEELDYVDINIPMGAISSNEIDVVLDNTDKRFSLANPDSNLGNLLKKNRKVTPWLGVEVLEGQIEWHKLGTFWTTNWQTPLRSLTATLTARDTLELLRQDDFETSQLYTNYTLAALYRVLFTAYGLTEDRYYIDNTLEALVIPYAWFDRMSYKDALSTLSKCALVKVFCDRDGVIQVKPISTTENSRYTFDDDKNYFDSDFPMLGTDITNYVEVLVNTLTPGEPTSIYDMETPMSVPAGESSDITCIYNSIPNVNVQNPVVTCDTGMSVTGVQQYVWGMRITVKNNNISAANVNSITVTGTPLTASGVITQVAQDKVSILEDGKIKSTVDCPFIQTVAYATELANTILQVYKNQLKDVSLDSRGNIAIAVGNVVKVKSEFDTEGTDYTVFRQDINWDGALDATVEGKKL